VDFGVTLPNFHYGAPPTRDHLLAVVRAAEDSGFTSLWSTDHILVGSAFPRYGTAYESLATLAWVAGKTERIRLGTSILVLAMRNAILAAKQIATIDSLSGGRVVIGVGAGWNEEEYRMLGADFKRRGRVLDESIRTMRALWTEERPAFSGDVYRFADTLFDPKPAQSGGPPIWIGGNSDAALSRTARLGDAWHADEVPPDEFAVRVASLDKQAADAGRKVSATIRYTVDLRAALRQGGTAQPQSADAETGMKGSFEAMRAFTKRYRDIGVTDFVCQFEHATPDDHAEFVRAFGREVIARR
jgi:probable F420-dependent oxidoreductase